MDPQRARNGLESDRRRGRRTGEGWCGGSLEWRVIRCGDRCGGECGDGEWMEVEGGRGGRDPGGA